MKDKKNPRGKKEDKTASRVIKLPNLQVFAAYHTIIVFVYPFC